MGNSEANADSIEKGYVRFLNSTNETISVKHYLRSTEYDPFEINAGEYYDKFVDEAQTYERFRVIDSFGDSTDCVIEAAKVVGAEKVIITKIRGNTFKFEIIPRSGMVSTVVGKLKSAFGANNAGGKNSGDGNAGGGLSSVI